MIEMLITNGFTGVKNSPVSNLAWTLLKKIERHFILYFIQVLSGATV